jgi:hypothetical protein
MQVCGRKWFEAVRQMSSSNHFAEFVSAMQRQLAGEPAGASPRSLSPPY